jgi:hypothetical protein
MSKPLTASGGSVTASLSLFDGRATVSLSAPMVELDQEEKLDFFGKGEVPQHAYGIPLDDNQPVIWSVQHSELQADPGEMAAARANYRSDLEDFFEGAEWISDATVANSQGRNWELLEFRTSVLHRWVYLTSWEGRILSCEFNVFGNVDGSGIVRSLFDSLMLD